MYHKVSRNTQDFLTVSAAQLEKQLRYIKKRYNIITLAMLNDHIKQNTPLPENSLLITFDDGFENNYHVAYPIFSKLKIPFAIFLVSDFIAKTLPFDGKNQSFMNANQLSEMKDLVQFGLHSSEHQNINDLAVSSWFSEIDSCKKKLLDLGIVCLPIWAYTYGQFPKKNKEHFAMLKDIFKQTGVVGALRIGNRINRLPLKNVFQINRIDIRGNQSFFRFMLKVMFGKIF